MNNLLINTAEIKNRNDFLLFLKSLLADLHTKDWDNNTLCKYVEAMGSWAEDMDGYYENIGLLNDIDLEKVNWRIFADILCAARIYE